MLRNMKSFQFHFNIKRKDDTIYDSFIFNPEKKDQEKLGNLYVAGQISNALPQSFKLLKTLSEIIKQEYFNSYHKDSNAAIKAALGKANEYLEEIVRQGNVNWMGNMDFAVLAVSSLFLNFVKIGNIKILLSRSGEIYDISENLEYQDSDMGPGSAFPNVAIGKLSHRDRLIVNTSDFNEFAQDQSLITEIIDLPEWSEKTISKQLKLYNEELKRVSGVMLLLDVGNEPGKAQFNFSLPSLGAKPAENKKPSEIQTDGNNFLKIAAGLISFGLLALVAFGFYKYSPFFGQQKPAAQITPQAIPATPSSSEPAKTPANDIATATLPFFEIKDESVKATGLLAGNDQLLVFSSGNKNIWKIDQKDKKLEMIATDNSIKFADSQQGIFFLFASDNTILKYDPKANKITKVQPVKLDSKAIITGFNVYTSKFYLLDSFNGRILRATGGATGDWLTANTRKPNGAKSLAIDKSLWILTKNNDLDRYFENSYKETIKLNASPSLQNPVKIWTSLATPNIYVLEPQQNRLCVFDKKGKLVKEYKESTWTDLRDFAVGSDGFIYILDGGKIYQIKNN